MSETADVLRRAAEILHERGWRDGPPQDLTAETGTCIMGAVAMARGLSGEHWRAAMYTRPLKMETVENRLIREVIREQFPDYVNEDLHLESMNVTFFWNDEAGSLESSVMVLEKAALLAEERGL